MSELKNKYMTYVIEYSEEENKQIPAQLLGKEAFGGICIGMSCRDEMAACELLLDKLMEEREE